MSVVALREKLRSLALSLFFAYGRYENHRGFCMMSGFSDGLVTFTWNFTVPLS